MDMGDLSDYDEKNPQSYRDEIIHFASYRRNANNLIRPLENMILLLERDLSRKNPRGTRKADDRNFVRNIAVIYCKHIRKPSSYPYGPSYAVVCAALEAIGLPSKNPGRGIKVALKT
jgi:hypothetical protein